MGTISKTKVYRSASERSELVAAYEASGLSQEAFCEREGIAKSSLYKWRRQQYDGRQGLGAGFISIESRHAPEWNIELEFKNGTVIRFK